MAAQSQAPTTDSLRDDIDRGKTGEKVSGPDPASAPLGADAEAGGESPTKLEREKAAADQKPARQPKTTSPSGMGSIAIYVAIAVVIAAIVIALVAFS